jgi:hypothetical protein
MEEWFYRENPGRTLIQRDKMLIYIGFESVRWIDVPAFHSAEVFYKKAKSQR